MCPCNTVCSASGRCEAPTRCNSLQDKSEKLQLRVGALERATVQQEAALHKLGRLSHRHIEVSVITLSELPWEASKSWWRSLCWAPLE